MTIKKLLGFSKLNKLKMSHDICSIKNNASHLNYY